MILHIPHSSRNLLGRTFLCDAEVELDRMTDLRTDVLFDVNRATRIVFPISRLVCDVERFSDDDLESMAKKGMGVCYVTNSFGEPLRNVSDEEHNRIIDDYYKPHHTALKRAVDEELETVGYSLIIDCHSFSDTPLPHEGSQSTPRPDICIGTDDYHTPEALSIKARNHFESLGYVVAINDPFAGSLVPVAYYCNEPRVHSLMIEVNRSIYQAPMDFERVKSHISQFLGSVETIND